MERYLGQFGEEPQRNRKKREMEAEQGSKSK